VAHAYFYIDAFVAKLTPEGALVYSSYLGGNFEDWGEGIALDMLGNVYVTGMTSSGDFPVTFDAFQPENKVGGCTYPFTCPDAFMTKIRDGGTILPRTCGRDVHVMLANGSQGADQRE
jgi:hypothetical protein